MNLSWKPGSPSRTPSAFSSPCAARRSSASLHTICFAAGEPNSMASATFLELSRYPFFPRSLCPCNRLTRLPLFPRLRHSHLRPRRYVVAFVSSSFGTQPDSQEQKPESAEALVIEPQMHKDGSQLRKRVVFGLIIGAGSGSVVVAGGWVFTILVSVLAFSAAREYFDLLRSQGISSGMKPPPRYVWRACSVICSLMPLLTA